MRARSILGVCSVMLVSACAGTPEKLNASIEQTNVKATRLVKNVGSSAPGTINALPSAAEYEEGIWLGKNVVKVNQAVLPAIFYENATFDLTVHSLSELAERITLRSGVPTKVSPDAVAFTNGVVTQTSTANAAPTANGMANPGSNGATATRPKSIRVAFANGSFKSLLDTVAARFGVNWKYINGYVQFYHTDSRSFQIGAIPGESTFSAAVSSAAGASQGSAESASGLSANNTQRTGVSSQLSVFGSIEKTVQAMLSNFGRVVASPATGTITVVDTPDALERVASYIEAENKSLSRQIMLNVTVLAVTLEKQDKFGIQWDMVYSGLLSKYGVGTYKSATMGKGLGDVSSGVIKAPTDSKFSGSSLIIEALSEQGKVRRETTASVVTLNNQAVPVQVATQKSYLKSSQTTLVANAGSTTTLTPGTVTSGFNMSILPHVLKNGTVMLQFSMDLSSLRQLRTVGGENNKLEMPEIDTRNFLQRVSMKSNETLIISGFEQTDDNLKQQGLGNPQNYWLGGGYAGGSNKEVIVILITPVAMAAS